MLVASLFAPTVHAHVIAPGRPEVRASGSIALESIVAPLRLHVPRATPAARARAWLADLEWAAARATALGWPSPLPDGGRGGSPSFDVYVVPSAGASSVAVPETQWPSVDRPAASAYAVVAETAAEIDFASCAMGAYVQASTYAIDPFEDVAWRRATGTFVAGVATGVLGGCTTGLTDVQADPWRGWFAPSDDYPDRPDGGALALLAMSARHDGGTGRFVRDLWELAGLRSDAGDPTSGLTLFQVWSESARGAGDSLRDNLTSEALERFLLEQPWRARTFPVGLALEGVTPIALGDPVRWPSLPVRVAGPSEGVEPAASSYVLLDPEGAPDDARLRVWLEGETGVEWGVTAIGLDSLGRESLRMEMPVRREPRGYLAIERVARYERLLFVVTALPLGVPAIRADAEIDARGFRLTLDR
ncbi:MAG: hypothetical protein IT379_09360 [Deltaproteobacteria bacterium]|nr:hypothetical protein [Deltaproteobacteria bacterium]